MTRRNFIAGAAAAAAPAGAAAGRSGLGLSPDCFVIARPSREPLDYIQYGYERGAAGVQIILTRFEPPYLKQVRERAEQLGMYLEVTTMLPKDDGAGLEAYEKTVKAAKEVGASCIRSVCLGGRRYETFSTLDEWKSFAKDSRAKLARAVAVMEKHRFPLALENHKDWTVEEMVPLLKSYSSEYLGTCIDWGNNLALLDDALEVIEGLAPFAASCHIKDMAVGESDDGYLIAEVALGRGILPLRKMLDIIRRVRPKVHYSLDMLTRNPLRIPCLTEKYWATFPERNGFYLARALRMVRVNKPARPLARVEGMERAAALALEQDNVRQSVEYARDQLGLTA